MRGAGTWTLGAVLLAASTGCSPQAPTTAPGAPFYGDAVPPPDTRATDFSETLHGIEIADPYRWLEDPADPGRQVWIAAQNRYTDSLLRTLPGYERVADQIQSLLAVEAIGFPHRRGERHYFTRRRPGQDLKVICLHQKDTEEEVLIDPHLMSQDHSKSVSILDVSRNGELIAYGLRHGGEDEVEIRIYDVETRRTLDDRLPKARYFAVSFVPDGRGFYYSRHGDDGGRILFHRLGTTPEEDREIFGGEGFDVEKILYGNLSDDGRQLVINVFHGAGAEKTEIYLQTPPGEGKIQEVVSDIDATFYGGVLGDKLVLHTNWKAPNGRILMADPSRADPRSWREIVPEAKKAVIQSVSGVGGRIFVNYLEDVHSKVLMFDLEGNDMGEVPLPTLGTVTGIRGLWDQDYAFISFSSFSFPFTIYSYQVSTARLEAWEQIEVPIDADQYEVEQVWYRSKDGARIPMFLVYRKGLEKDGSNPVLLTGYGGFNTSQTPFFLADTAFWVERGGVYAVANIRGGGEFGADWHRAGVQENRQTVFNDFIAAAEWLIEEQYTQPEKLAISGHSNGGLLVAAAMTQRPDLFRAVVASHPLTDMLRYHKFRAGRFWIPEYGSPDDPEDFEYLYAYSPYHRLEEGRTYPATLFITGEQDTRVAPLHALKMAAKMQGLATSDRPVLLRHERLAGHAVEGSQRLRIEDLTDTMSFLLWQLNEEL